jgi:hypothetical protein
MALNLDAGPGFDADVAANFFLRFVAPKWKAKSWIFTTCSSAMIGGASRTLPIAHYAFLLAARAMRSLTSFVGLFE